MNAARLALAFMALTIPLRSGRIDSGSANCPASGAAQLGAGLATINAYQVFLQAPTANTGTIVVGGPSVTATPPTGFQLVGTNAADELLLAKPNAGVTLQSIWYACTMAADKLLWVASE